LLHTMRTVLGTAVLRTLSIMKCNPCDYTSVRTTSPKRFICFLTDEWLPIWLLLWLRFELDKADCPGFDALGLETDDLLTLLLLLLMLLPAVLNLWSGLFLLLGYDEPVDATDAAAASAAQEWRESDFVAGASFNGCPMTSLWLQE